MTWSGDGIVPKAGVTRGWAKYELDGKAGVTRGWAKRGFDGKAGAGADLLCAAEETRR